MALPQVNNSRYEVVIPSTGQKVSYRPYLVKEEKVLMMAMESNDTKQIMNATIDIIKSCVYDDIDVDKLAMFDIETLFIALRAKSVGEISKFKVICPDDKQTATDVELDLSTVEVQVDDEHNNNVVIDEERKLGLVLNYPSLGITKAGFDVNKENVDTMFNVVASCIDHIYEGDKTYPAKDSTKKELVEFLEGLSQQAFIKIRKFFDTMPQLRHEVEVTNPKTGVKSKVTFKGLQDFFQ